MALARARLAVTVLTVDAYGDHIGWDISPVWRIRTTCGNTRSRCFVRSARTSLSTGESSSTALHRLANPASAHGRDSMASAR